jgi:site-specific DNA-methyltransferase (adenine-specific)
MTATSNFGVSRRESHNAQAFYDRFSAPEISDDKVVNDCTVKDQVFVGNSTDMIQVPDKSVALVVSSPAYHSGKSYEEDLGSGHVPATYLEYLAQLTQVFEECRRVLEPGGRIAINVANLGRKPYRSLSADIIRILQDDLGFLLRGEIIWQKGVGASGNCAWGSFMRPSNPVLRDLTERIIVASKGRFDRAPDVKTREAKHMPHEATISKEDFMAWTLDVWHIPPASATRIGHPAPFPVELPRRFIELYTYKGDVVLDPFMGSGTTAVACIETDRHFVGFDADQSYVDLSLERIAAARKSREDEEAA